jgi:hypothetical protein
MLFPMINVSYFYISTFQSMCAVSSMAVVCSSLMLCLLGVILRWFQLAPLLLVSLLFLHSTYAVFLLIGLYRLVYKSQEYTENLASEYTENLASETHKMSKKYFIICVMV